MSNMTNKDHIDWLKEKLARYETELSKAEAIVAKFRPIAISLSGTIAALEAEELGEVPSKGLWPEGTLPEAYSEETPLNGQQERPISPFAPGVKKSARMPNRYPKYTNISILNAAGQILESSTGPLHADEIVPIIYDVRTREEFKAAKQSLVSELLRGVEKNRWRKLGGNRYVKNRP